MINLHYHNNYYLVFDVDDWNILRTKYRIVGEFIGNTGKIEDLPVALTAEEANLLVKKKIAKLISYTCHSTLESKTLYDEDINKLYEDEKIILKEERKKEVTDYINKIILGKKNKGIKDISSTDILNDEMSKLTELKKENMITLTSTQHPDYMKGTEEVSSTIIFKTTTPTKCAVYEDLWEKGYFITTARKFGGDFLVYLGDPVAYHAVYIVKCVENQNSQMSSLEIIMFGRLGNSVKKKFVLASLSSEQTVKYITLNWMES